MPVTLYDIRVTSNAARTFAKDAMGATASTKAIERNIVAMQTRDQILANTRKRQTTLRNTLESLNKITKKNTALTLRNAIVQRISSKASRTAGINFGMLSLRISEGLVPVLAVLYTAMLPVAAGLLAIASAAVVATGGVLGLMGVGLYAWSKRFKSTQSGYAGARRPYSSGTEADFGKELMSGFVKVLDDPAIKRMIDTAVEWTQTIFRDILPNAFKTFLLNVDMGAMDKIMVMFTEWLPDAATGLARWGSSLFNKIGASSLNMLNRFFKYLANGMLSIADWLNAEGFKQIESLADIIGQLAGQLMDLGKKALPVLVDVLKAAYPYPIKPVLEMTSKFFDAVSKSEVALGIIKLMIQMFLAMVALKGIEMFLVSFIGLIDALAWGIGILLGVTGGVATLLAAIVILGTAGLLWLATKSELVKGILVSLGTLIINFGIAVYNNFAKLFAFILNSLNWLTGDEKRYDFTKDYRQLKYNTGENIWSPVMSNTNNNSSQNVNVNVTIDENKFGLGVLNTLSKEITGVRGGANGNV